MIENQIPVGGELDLRAQHFADGKIFQGRSFIVRSQTLMLKQSLEIMYRWSEQKRESTEEQNAFRLSVSDPWVC